MKAVELLQAQRDINTISIALSSVGRFFQAFRLRMPQESLAAIKRLENFLESLMESEVSLIDIEKSEE